MGKLSRAEVTKIADLHKQIQFYGTEENGYADSGLWTFLQYVYTNDSHDKDKPVKRLMEDAPVYLVVMFLYWLACQAVANPKSRQMRVSWATTAFSVWHTMTAPYRRTIYQTKKEDDAFAMVSQGAKNPTAGRMDFIIQHLPAWLRDPNIASGRGNQVGALNFTPKPVDEPSGVPVPWYGGTIHAIPQGGHQVRQYTPSLFISDESAFQEEFESAMVAVRPAVAGGGKIICVSSVDNGSAFNRMVLESHDGKDPLEEIHPIVQRGLDAFGLEWPKGLRAWETPSGVNVLEVHYTADPAKDPARDGAAWVEEALKGYVGGKSSDGWQTEMEINYKAGGGSPVFPFLISRKHPIFSKKVSVDEVINKHKIYAGFDDGADADAAFEVWSFDKDGQPHAVWELYEPATNVGVFVQRLKECPYWDHIQYMVCDPAITAKNQRTASGTGTVHELFTSHDVYFTPGRRGVDVAQARRMISDYWSDPMNPKAFITDNCPHLQEEFMDLRWERHLSEAVENRKNNPEKIRQKKNHGCDATFYLFDTRPRLWVAPIDKRPQGMIFDDLLTLADKKLRLEKTRRGRRQLLEGTWR